MTAATLDHPPVPGTPRRSFLRRAGAWLLTGAFVGQGAALLRALWPDVLYEPSPRFKVGTPRELGEGLTFIEPRRLFVWRRGNDYYAMSAVCTHLGCTVKPGAGAAGAQEFHCPCHGSRYREDGTNYAGPAPRPLERYRMEIAPDDGQLLVDSDAIVDKSFRLTVRV
jgi:menaquinol-cytochrome c reductase iron-sulfur subunit